METNQGSVPASISPMQPMAVSSRDPSAHSDSLQSSEDWDVMEARELPGAAASHRHDQGGRSWWERHTQETGIHSARQGLTDWVLPQMAPCCGLDCLRHQGDLR